MQVIYDAAHAFGVEVDGEITGKIDEGLMALVGFGENDTTKEADYLARKLAKLRIFPDEDGKMNKSVLDINGKLLLVPQFTLYGKVKKYRPSFHRALAPDKATELFDYFTDKCREYVEVETGVFGAFMKVDLLNNGPVTILLEKEFDD